MHLCSYAARATPVSFEAGNAFILPQHEGKFDRVHVGGLCTPAKLPALVKLLKPEGGRLVVPCGPELLAVTVTPDKVRQQHIFGAAFDAAGVVHWVMRRVPCLPAVPASGWCACCSELQCA